MKTSAHDLSPILDDEARTLIDDLLAEQKQLTAVEAFARVHHRGPASGARYQSLLPAVSPGPGQQYAFEVDLDKCSGCKACVTACHSLNGLDDDESWRAVGLLVSPPPGGRSQGFDFAPVQQHVTTACHHCIDPGCLNGCPVLAYDKDPATGVVRHLDDQCMGCSYCVMKCPYEVPRYSTRLGIVRKCDLCSSRLASGEAPACAQACPSEAIRITIVDHETVRARFGQSPDESPGTDDEPRLRSPRSAPRESSGDRPGGFLPDSPDPRLTHPTTRFVSRRALPDDLRAADHDSLRLEPTHGPLVAMLVLTQAATGLWWAGVAAAVAGSDHHHAVVNTTAFGLLAAGLASSILHLGRPSKAWRAFLGWRRSWLSREIIAFNAAMMLATVALLAAWLPGPPWARMAWTALAGAAGLIGVFTSSMVYIDTGRPIWGARLTMGNFLGTTLLLGSALAAVSFAWLGWAQPGLMADAGQLFGAVATVTRAALFGWRRLELRRALDDVASPIHWNAQVLRTLQPGALRLQTILFVGSTAAGLLAVGGAGSLAPFWATVAATGTLVSELVGRSFYFAAGGARRMPGGVTQ